MCLTVNDGVRIPKIATEDIHCYKVVKSVRNFYITPYRNMIVEMRGKYESVLDNPVDCEIERGFHSIANKKGASIELQYWHFRSMIPYSYMIAECIIPKGAFYYEGRFDGVKSYASDKIKYIKII